MDMRRSDTGGFLSCSGIHHPEKLEVRADMRKLRVLVVASNMMATLKMQSMHTQ